jgi:Uma2 family endonuclease
VIASGGVDKLAIYRGLGVREVWFWRNDRFEIRVLDGEDYRILPRSQLVPQLDFERMAEFVLRPNQHAAVSAYRNELRKTAG